MIDMKSVAQIDEELMVISLEEMSSVQEQRCLWLNLDHNNEMHTFEEAWCGIFDDSGLSRSLEKNLFEKQYGENLRQKLEKLSKLLKKVPQEIPDWAKIEHPSMEAVRKLAREILADLKQ